MLDRKLTASEKAFLATRPQASRDPHKLTETEQRVAFMLASGASNRKIGTQLALAESTVKMHVHNILVKLQVSNRTQAAVKLAYSAEWKLHSNIDRVERKPFVVPDGC